MNRGEPSRYRDTVNPQYRFTMASDFRAPEEARQDDRPVFQAEPQSEKKHWTQIRMNRNTVWKIWGAALLVMAVLCGVRFIGVAKNDNHIAALRRDYKCMLEADADLSRQVDEARDFRRISGAAEKLSMVSGDLVESIGVYAPQTRVEAVTGVQYPVQGQSSASN